MVSSSSPGGKLLDLICIFSSGTHYVAEQDETPCLDNG